MGGLGEWESGRMGEWLDSVSTDRNTLGRIPPHSPTHPFAHSPIPRHSVHLFSLTFAHRSGNLLIVTCWRAKVASSKGLIGIWG